MQLQSGASLKFAEPDSAPAPTPAVLLSDDPADPRGRPNLKATRHYLENSAHPASSKYRAELAGKVGNCRLNLNFSNLTSFEDAWFYSAIQ